MEGSLSFYCIAGQCNWVYESLTIGGELLTGAWIWSASVPWEPME